MPSDVTEVALLRVLRELRRGRRRFSATIITTYTVNFPFYENVVLRYLLGAGSRLNIVLADAGQIAKAFLTESTRPHGAGTDYLLLPVSTFGAFHPKILSLLSDKGMAIAIGSHNLTEAGFGRNVELCATIGFGEDAAPLNLAQPVIDYLLQCAGQIALGDETLSARLKDRLRSLSLRGQDVDEELAFAASQAEGASLLDRAFERSELEQAERILVLGPYFDSDLRFLTSLRERAPRAEIVVAVQPEYVVMKRADKWPARTRVCNAGLVNLPRNGAFIHAKAIVVDGSKKLVMALGSANPTDPAWLGKHSRRNFEAMIMLRGRKATQAYRDLGLGQLWKAPTLTKEELEQIAKRSRATDDDSEKVGIVPVAGLWKDGWVETRLSMSPKQLKSIAQYHNVGSVDLAIEAAEIKGDILRFPATAAGVFAVRLSGQTEPTIVIASSASTLAPSLVSSTTGRLIDELGRLDGGAAPGDDLLNLCEKVLLQPEEEGAASPKVKRRSTVSETPPAEEELSGPRGISMRDKPAEPGARVNVSLDISAIITLLLKDLQPPVKDKGDPGADQTEESDEGDDPDDAGPEDRQDAEPQRHWNDVIDAVRPRITRLLRQLSKGLEEKHSAKWKYERILLTLALFKRLRKFHPGQGLPVFGRPARLVDQAQVRQVFKLAMRYCFAREVGLVGVLERAGGVDAEHDVIGRALLFWAAYEAETDVAAPPRPNLEPEKIRAVQCDRTDALIAAIAASASPLVVQRARRELFDRGDWREPRDAPERLEKWFNRHSQLGLKLQKAISGKRPTSFPVSAVPPSMNDILVWKMEPGWPRLPQLISGRTVHLSDVGDAEPLRITQQFVQVVDLKSLGVNMM